jgi:hypothetical protein
MEWHLLTDTKKHNAIEFEETIMKKIGMIKEILPRYSS